MFQALYIYYSILEPLCQVNGIVFTLQQRKLSLKEGQWGVQCYTINKSQIMIHPRSSSLWSTIVTILMWLACVYYYFENEFGWQIEMDGSASVFLQNWACSPGLHIYPSQVLGHLPHEWKRFILARASHSMMGTNLARKCSYCHRSSNPKEFKVFGQKKKMSASSRF